MIPDDPQHLILDSAERMVNTVLSLDEELQEPLATFAGKVFEVDVVNTDIRIFILPSGDGVKLEPAYEGKADVVIKGRPSVLLGLITAGKISVGDIEIIGNVGLAQQFQSILKNMEVDWEEYLSHYLGDISAHKVGNLLRGMFQFAKSSGNTIGLNISEYLRYEKEALLDKSELDEFNHAVDIIRNDVERLQKRVVRLQKKENA